MPTTLTRWIKRKLVDFSASHESGDFEGYDQYLRAELAEKAARAGLPQIVALCKQPGSIAELFAAAIAELTPAWLTVPIAAQQLGVTPETVRAWINEGRLAAVNTSKGRPRWKISREALRDIKPAPERHTRTKLLVTRYTAPKAKTARES